MSSHECISGAPATPFASLASWRHHQRIEQRVVGQLLQTLLFEDVLRYEVAPASNPAFAGNTLFTITLGNRCYQVYGWLCHSFQIIRLEHSSLTIVPQNGAPEPTSLQQFIDDIESVLGGGAIQPG
ncbi:MAG: achromobactin biosynthesis protein AcsC, partial [Halomonas sp. HL-93]